MVISSKYFDRSYGSVRVITVFTVFRLLTDFVCLYTYKFWLSLCKIVRSSVILLLPLFTSESLSSKSAISNLLQLKRFSSGKAEQLPQLHLLAHMLQKLWVLFGTCWRSDSLKNAFNIGSLRQSVDVTTAFTSGSPVCRL